MPQLERCKKQNVELILFAIYMYTYFQLSVKAAITVPPTNNILEQRIAKSVYFIYKTHFVTYTCKYNLINIQKLLHSYDQ